MPSIDDFLPPEILFQGTPFAINRIIFVRILATIIMLLVLGITAARAKLVPGRWQGAVEWLIEFIKKDIVYQVMGEVRGKRYVPMITTVFLTLLVFNLCGEVPGMNIAASATITLPLVFAMVVLRPVLDCGHSREGGSATSCATSCSRRACRGRSTSCCRRSSCSSCWSSARSR